MELPGRRIVLLGKTGDGKSTAGNTILGKNAFTAKASASSVTSEYESKEGMVNGRKITIIDTPGIFDTERDDAEMRSELSKALVECAPGVDAYVIVLRVGRYTKQEMEVIQELLNMLEETVLKHSVILFTFGDQLENQTLEEFIKGNSQLQQLVEKFQGRHHVIDSRYWNDRQSGSKSNSVQVKNLLETIDKMVLENGRYTNDLLKHLEMAIQNEARNIPGSHLPPEAKLEKAKKVVQKRILIAGAATGALIGALLGVGVALVSIFTFIQPLINAKALLLAAGGATTGVGGATAVAGGGAAAVGGATAVAGGGAAAVGGATAVAGGGAAAVGGATAVAGGGAAAVGGATAVAGGGAAAVGGATAAGVVFGVAAAIGAVGGGITGYKASEEADSVYDAMKNAAELNYENAKTTVEKVQEFANHCVNKK